MNKKLNYICLLLLSSILCSCDPGVVNSYVVKNSSEYDLVITAKLNQHVRPINEIDSLKITLIKKGEEKEIIRYGEIGRAHDKNEAFLESIESLHITNQEENIKLKYLNRKIWKYQIVNQGNFSLEKVKYILEIGDNDVK